eukprot:CAMPEP_0114994346 /NCGR_PEP_ID=MMETSP0216-20121206/13075_1 /TAXON_ID=223996 /ORGANISM="Protocruzia adherens, Strain Boccale" /LENGTH=309 /DNA_ID=CAMNT_0002358171 /DNA_START=140 /DNA_END=1069 /DNA_ORIENTATION=+
MARTFWSVKRNEVDISVNQANIVREPVECIVNAANEHLAHGGGVAGAISSAAGREFDKESRDYVRANGIVDTGEACITGSGRLEQSAGITKVIHAVGPIYSNGKRNEEYLLYSTVKESLELAHREGISSISIPAISSGIFGFPKPRCGEIMLAAVLEFVDNHTGTELKTIRLSNFDFLTADIFHRTAENQEFMDNYAAKIPKDQAKERAKKSQTTAAAVIGDTTSGTEDLLSGTESVTSSAVTEEEVKNNEVKSEKETTEEKTDQTDSTTPVEEKSETNGTTTTTKPEDSKEKTEALDLNEEAKTTDNN